MRPGWVAGTARARGLARRRLGRQAVAEVARLDNLPDALRALGATPYGRLVRADMELGAAQQAVAASALWHLRVLAGWLRPDGVELLRTVAGWYEIANIEDRLADSGAPSFELGALALTWPRVAGTANPALARESLARTFWGDPGLDEPLQVGLILRLVWAMRLATTTRAAVDWGAGLAAILASQVIGAGRADWVPSRVRSEAGRLLGPNWEAARSVEELVGRLPHQATWVFGPEVGVEELWRSPFRWWDRVEQEGLGLLRSGSGADVIVGVAMGLVADAWRVGAALEVVARGGGAELADVLG